MNASMNAWVRAAATDRRVPLYRAHRRLLAESMETVTEMPSFDALVAHLHDYLSICGVEVTASTVHIESYGGEDKRIGWPDVHIVSVDGFGVCGFTSCALPGTPSP